MNGLFPRISLDRLRQRIDETQAWDELRTALGSPVSADELKRSADLWHIHAAFGSASAKSESLRQKLLEHPIPDWNQIGKYSDFSLQYHLESGLTDACHIADSIATHTQPAAAGRPLAILDFGAGLGRILRYLSQFVTENNYFASEVNPLAVTWAQQAYPKVRFFHTESAPPLTLPAASLDAAYAWSIFSHYAEGLHQQWLKDLARTLRPGGLLILTTQGRTLIDRIAKEENVRQVMRLPSQQAWDALDQQYEAEGYGFYECYTEADARDFGIDSATFGMAFISPAYIQKNWTRDYELIEYSPGKISNWQDYVVLRKR